MPEFRPSWLMVGRRLALSLGIFLIIPSFFLAGYLFIFDAPASSVAPHILLIANLAAGVAGIRLALGVVPIRSAVRRGISASLVAAIILAMFLFYSLVFVGLKFWGRVTTFDVAIAYAPQVVELFRALGYYPPLIGAVIALFLVGAWSFVYVFLSRYDWVVPFNQNVSKSVVAMLACGLLMIFTISTASVNRGWSAKGEPFSLSLFPEKTETVMQSHSMEVFYSAELDREENVVRLAYQPVRRELHSNVIVIVVDALRADHLSLLGYSRKTSPNLEKLAKAGAVQFASSALTVCNESSCGLRALSSSRYLDKQAAKPITLQEVLKMHGYRNHLVFSGDHTNFYGISKIYGAVDSYFDGVSQKDRYLNDDRIIVDYLKTFSSWDGTPAMFQFHLMSAHALGPRFEETPKFGDEENYSAIRWGTQDAKAPQRAVNFYDRGVLQADQIIEKILSQLKEKGYLQNAVLLITGDHGESLGERGLYSHSHNVWEEALRVPFLLLTFGAADAEKLKTWPLSSQVDMAPTLLRALGLPIPATWEGVPMQNPIQPRVVYFQQSQFVGLVDGRMPGTLYKHWKNLRTGQQFTFDLLIDPKEENDLALQVSPSLRQDWERLLASRSAALAPAVKERLNQSVSNNIVH
jgi:glucan phosphoethanolaminetransferase (alkaline phosphatase superfamily)